MVDYPNANIVVELALRQVKSDLSVTIERGLLHMSILLVHHVKKKKILRTFQNHHARLIWGFETDSNFKLFQKTVLGLLHFVLKGSRWMNKKVLLYATIPPRWCEPR